MPDSVICLLLLFGSNGNRCGFIYFQKKSILKDYGVMLCSSADRLGITVMICSPPGVWEEDVQMFRVNSQIFTS